MSNFKNIVINATYQLFLVVIPIITIPYIARVLGAQNLGLYGYTTSIINFLGIIINFGMNQIGVREIAKTETATRIRLFFKLWKIQFISGIIISFCYIAVIFLLAPNNNAVYFCQIFFLISFIFDISWFFIGMGQIKKVTLRNTGVKLIGIFLIFILIKDSNDLLLYVLINGVTFLLSNIFFWIEILSINKNERNYFKPVPSSLTFVKISFVLLLPQIAVQIYTSLNTTLVGILTDSLQVSYYDQSQKISRMVLAIVTSISVVLMPRLAEKKDDKEIFNMVSTSLFYTTFVSALFLVIVSSNSNTFVPWFFGDEFLSMRVNMKLSSLIILFISFGGVFSTQFALARGYDKEFSIPYYIGVFTNIGLNLVLIPKFGALGASVTLVLTEITVCFFRVFIVRKKIDLKKLLDDADILKILIIALISFSISILPIFNFENPLFEMLLRSIVISFVFMFLSIILKTRILNDFQIFLKKYNGRK